MLSCMAILRLLALAVLPVSTLAAQSVSNAHASYIDVAARHEQLAHNQDPRTAKAIASLASCTKLPEVAPPTGRMIIPPHYISGGHGPINPEEAKVTRTYNAFEHRISAGMNQWLATGSKDEAQCAQHQIDTWAQAATLLDYDPKESLQAWFQVEWTLSSVAITESVLVNEPTLDPAVLQRDIGWMNRAAHKTVDFDKASKATNNHHYWRGLAATAVGVISSDNDLFSWGVGVYKQAIDELNAQGALPQEMARHERAIHYQSFALQPLLPLAEFAERQHVPLYAYRSPSGRTVIDAVNFFGAAVANPDIVKPYASETQLLEEPGGDFYAFAEFYAHHVPPAAIPHAILHGLSEPTFATRIGGNITVVDGFVPAPK